MLGKVDPLDDAYLTSDQYNMLLAIDPKFKDKYQVDQDEQNNLRYKELAKKSDKFAMSQPLDGAYANPMNTQGDTTDEVGGGFPFLPLALAGIPSLISGVFNLFKKRKDGSGEIAYDYLMTQKPRIDAISQMDGYGAWKELQNITRDTAHHVFSRHPDFSGSGAFAHKLSQGVVNKAFPQLLQHIIAQPGGSGKCGSGALTPEKLAFPVVEYGVRKLADGYGPVSRQVLDQVFGEMRKGSGIYGGKPNWRKVWRTVRDISKKALHFAAPIIGNIAKSQLNNGVAKKAIDGVLGKIGFIDKINKYMPSVTRDSIADFADKAIKTGVTKGLDVVSKATAPTPAKVQEAPVTPSTEPKTEEVKEASGFLRNPTLGRGFINPPAARGVYDKKKDMSTFQIKLF